MPIGAAEPSPPHAPPINRGRSYSDVRLMELHKIIISEMQEQQIIVLKEVDGDRKFPDRHREPRGLRHRAAPQGERSPRPLTHDLLASVVESMGGTIERIEINNLQEHTFYRPDPHPPGRARDQGGQPAQRRHRPGRDHDRADLRRRAYPG